MIVVNIRSIVKIIDRDWFVGVVSMGMGEVYWVVIFL